MSKTNTACLIALNITHSCHTIDGNDYVVTSGTGEGTFIYDATDVEAESIRWMRKDAAGGQFDYEVGPRGENDYCYQEFCDHMHALTGVKDGPDGQHMTWECAVILAAKEQILLDNPGVCIPMLSRAEYELIRLAVRA